MRQRAFVERFVDALFDGGNEVARDRTADNLIDEFEAAAFVRLDHDRDAGVLAVAARLLLVDVLRLDLRGDGLAVGDFRRVQVDFDAELPLHLLRGDFDVRFAHAGDDRFAGGLVAVHVERRIFFGDTVQRRAELVDVCFAFRCDGDVERRLRKLQRRQRQRVLLRAECVAGDGLRELRDGADVAGDE